MIYSTQVSADALMDKGKISDYLVFYKSRLTYILGTMWHSSRKNTNMTTKT